MGIPELNEGGLHPDHVGPLQAALANARELLGEVTEKPDEAEALEEERQVKPESPWPTSEVTSWVSPHHQPKKGKGVRP